MTPSPNPHYPRRYRSRRHAVTSAASRAALSLAAGRFASIGIVGTSARSVDEGATGTGTEAPR